MSYYIFQKLNGESLVIFVLLRQLINSIKLNIGLLLEVEDTQRCIKGLKSQVKNLFEKTQVNLNIELYKMRISNIIDAEWFSDLDSLYRVTSYVRKFRRNLKTIKIKEEDFLTEMVNVEEVSDVENYWIRDMQLDIHKMNKFPQQFTISTDKNGILRAKGRI